MKTLSTTEILKQEINNELSMVKEWREKQQSAKSPEIAEYYRVRVMRSICRAEAKCDVALSLGYFVAFTDDRDECLDVYSMELDD